MRRIRSDHQGRRSGITDYLTGEQRLGRLATVAVEATTSLLSGATMTLALKSLMMGTAREELHRELTGIVSTLIHGLTPPHIA